MEWNTNAAFYILNWIKIYQKSNLPQLFQLQKHSDRRIRVTYFGSTIVETFNFWGDKKLE